MLEPGEFAAGESPLDQTTFFPYYQGTFDQDGNPIYPYSDVQPAEMDPLLYWLIPIFRKPEPAASAIPQLIRPQVLMPQRTKNRNAEVVDFLEKHAGTKHWEDGK
jgi:hypothetical protein